MPKQINRRGLLASLGAASAAIACEGSNVLEPAVLEVEPNLVAAAQQKLKDVRGVLVPITFAASDGAPTDDFFYATVTTTMQAGATDHVAIRTRVLEGTFTQAILKVGATLVEWRENQPATLFSVTQGDDYRDFQFDVLAPLGVVFEIFAVWEDTEVGTGAVEAYNSETIDTD
jgi:hypothetical protein